MRACTNGSSAVPVLALTGDADAATTDALIDAGATDVSVKGGTDVRLIDVVRRFALKHA